ncbi:MAG: preprotein translocase subunit YajC [Hyphomicrobiaceae bacterium]|jgi:preprotein translocase subunit YajC
MTFNESMGPIILAQVGGEAFQQFIPLLLILAVFYFLLIRPQQQQAKEHTELVASLKKADRVVTTSGLFGTIVEVKEQSIMLEVANGVKVRMERDKIASREGGNKQEG